MARYGLFVLKVPLNPNQPTLLHVEVSHAVYKALLATVYCQFFFLVRIVILNCRLKLSVVAKPLEQN